METERIIQGRCITPETVAQIRGLLADNPSWHRTRLSRELCARWDWRNDKGRLKDMAARTLLLKLERLGEIRLPERQRPSPNGYRNCSITDVPHDNSPIESNLRALQPLEIAPLEAADKDAPLFKSLLHRYHYLGHRHCVGENLKVMIRDQSGRLLACMLFGSAAWKTKSRDAFIGWERQTRERNLPFLTNNTRFLILPWVRVKNLASHLLAQVCRELPRHWIEKYGHPIHLLETFVERDRFRGTCYRAAGWTHVGTTAGRSRNDVYATMNVPVKDVFLYPLTPDFRRRLIV
ncbi:MAG: DUF4338 domain-containing protein [Planctomycetota bacterium]|jgi:hypothetical protein|nr:DUF4338 domain-containing protein [Planctomycetota bacterium]